ncbi:MAG TPA: AAA family ATPase [Coleofasciculaceae cyanobacterium]
MNLVGLTILVGPNNAGKSTIIEALHAISRPPNTPPSFTEGKRNKCASGRVRLRVQNSEGQYKELTTVPRGGSQTQWNSPDIEPLHSRIFVLPSRRTFNPYFGKGGSFKREQYIDSFEIPPTRGSALNFHYRLFEMQDNSEGFNKILEQIINPVPEWYIDQSDTGQYYLKFRTGNEFHTSDGMGEGLVSLFFIVDALYDSNPGNIIVIDEPELSLHPYFQKRLRKVLCDFAKDRQIIFATHSPQLIDWKAIASGASIIRVRQCDNRSVIFELTNETKRKIGNFLRDLNNPHVLGLEASEVFFLEDGVILVEGQEDVIFFPKVLEQLEINIPGDFYGWGVGGASNMPVIASMLQDLGFERVVGILDQNMTDKKGSLQQQFPNYLFEVIPANDVRTKDARRQRIEVIGLLDEKHLIRENFKQETINLFERITKFFQG